MRKLTVGSLFAGIGGFDLGLERAGFEVRWQVEIDPFCRKVLEKHWPAVRRYEDVRTVHHHDYCPLGSAYETCDECAEPVDVLIGGFPCQDISFAAGAGAEGLDGKRSGLWGEYRRLIGEFRPDIAVVENVAALLARGMGRVLGDLAGLGYDALWSSLSACSVGAPHMRRRVFIVAHADRFDGRSRLRDSIARAFRPLQVIDGFEGARAGYRARMADPSQLYGGSNGLPDRLERNRAIGNAVHPDVAEWIGRRILDAEAERLTA